MAGYILAILGSGDPSVDLGWKSEPFIDRVVRFRKATPDGLRCGSRILGLGLDSLIVALRARPRGNKFIASNPWVAAALRCLGARNVVVLGLYAQPGTRSWRVLRSLLGKSTVIAVLDSERASWNAEGGRALFVHYGTNFPYGAPSAKVGERLSIFIGGTSDRDLVIVDRLRQEVLESIRPTSLILALGGAHNEIVRGENRITEHSRLAQPAFGDAMATADIVLLPLQTKLRSSGHSVAVGALQLGLPVATTDSPGMQGYIDGDFIRTIDPSQDLLPQLRKQVDEMANRTQDILKYWESRHSMGAYLRAVRTALAPQLEVD